MSDTTPWLPGGGLSLEPNAYLAATSDEGSVLVTAGPGSGKTEMLAQRADYLLSTGACRYPERILAISFKRDAASNLRERVKERCQPNSARRLDSLTFSAFAKSLVDRFGPVLTGADEVSREYSLGTTRNPPSEIHFDDLAPLATKILTANNWVLKALRATYGFVFLDEFQDCTNEQYALLKTAFHGSPGQLTAVGDDKQRIMTFAGAMSEIFAIYIQDFSAAHLPMYQNHRSLPVLRRAQNSIIKILDPAAAMPDEELLGDEGVIEDCRFDTATEEAQALATKIHGWVYDEAVPVGEIAVLVARYHAPHTEDLQAALDAREIPWRDDVLVQDLTQEPIAMLVLDFLNVIVGTRQPDAYQRLLELAQPWEQDDHRAEARGAHLTGVIDRARVEYLLAEELGFAPTAVPVLVETFLGCLSPGHLISLSPEYAQGDRLPELTRSVLARIDELVTETGDVAQALANFAPPDAVRIMTIHKSKGLEFDRVIVVPVDRYAFIGTLGEVMRLFFVAISRARSHVTLAISADRGVPAAPPARRWDSARQPYDEVLDAIEHTGESL